MSLTFHINKHRSLLLDKILVIKFSLFSVLILSIFLNRTGYLNEGCCGNTIQKWSHDRTLRVCEKTPRKSDVRVVSSVSSKNGELFLDCAFMLLPGAGNRSELTAAVIIHMPLQKNRFLSHADCPGDCIICSGDSS